MRSHFGTWIAAVAVATAMLGQSLGAAAPAGPVGGAPAAGAAATATRPAAQRTSFTVCWSVYAGWNPWQYAADAGILQRWAAASGIDIELVRMDYIPSVEAFVAEQVDACTMTNMEALNMPAASGIDSTVLIVGDFSNGNDAILARNGIVFDDLPGRTIYGVELSVSEYLVSRALDLRGFDRRDVRFANVSDADIAPAFIADTSQDVVVTWNPMVLEILELPGVTKIFDSSDTPGEILDLLVVNTEVLEDNPAFGDALVGAWYDVMSIMSSRGARRNEALNIMADVGGSSLAQYEAMLRTTAMFYRPADAVEFVESDQLKDTMEFVRQFSFSKGLLGEGARSADIVGIAFPDGTVQGDRGNVRLRFDATWMRKADAGTLTAP